MPHMKILTALSALTLTAAFTLTTVAQDVAGKWQAESVSEVEPPEGASLTLSFGQENKATVTYTLAGESQSWQYTYSVADGQLMLEPAAAFGEPQTVTYDIKFDEGKLLLLTPKPEPVEEEADDKDTESEAEGDAAETEGDAEGDAEPDAEASEKGDAEEGAEAEESAEEGGEEDVEEEDTRVPVWVLVKA